MITDYLCFAVATASLPKSIPCHDFGWTAFAVLMMLVCAHGIAKEGA